METLDTNTTVGPKPMQALNLLKQGINQKEVAAKLGVSQATISNWYNQYIKFGIEAVMNDKKVGRKPKN